jgi:hypothetical protein
MSATPATRIRPVLVGPAIADNGHRPTRRLRHGIVDKARGFLGSTDDRHHEHVAGTSRGAGQSIVVPVNAADNVDLAARERSLNLSSDDCEVDSDQRP